jgi:predicted metalloprotease
MQFKKSKLVLFTGAVETACGNATSASGPFYALWIKSVHGFSFKEPKQEPMRTCNSVCVIAHEYVIPCTNASALLQSYKCKKEKARLKPINSLCGFRTS